ncbi:MAG: S8 family serine peptidase, partial [Pseudomonadota bacterium]
SDWRYIMPYEKSIFPNIPSITTLCVITFCGIALTPICWSGTLGEARQPKKAVILDRGTYIGENGRRFTYTKQRVDGLEETLFFDGKRTLTRDEMLEWEQQNPAPVIKKDLMRQAIRADAKKTLELAVWLTERPGSKIAREVRDTNMPAIHLLAEELRDVHRPLRPAGPLSPKEEESLRRNLGGRPMALTPKEKKHVKQLSAKIEQRMTTVHRTIRKRSKAAVAPSQARFRQKLRALGGSLVAALPVQNIIVVRLPANQLERLAEFGGIARIRALPEAVPALDESVATLGVDTGFWSAGIDGGIWDVGVLDSCAETSHRNLAHVQMLNSNNCHGDDWWGDGHGTQVTGIIASNHSFYKGLAFDIDRMLIGNAARSRFMADADWMVNGSFDDAEVINHSFGYGTRSSDYTSIEQFFDGLIDDERVMISQIAGNGGPGTKTLSMPARAYNPLTVADMSDGNDFMRANDVIASDSSRGATPGGRKKPDITAPGSVTTTGLNNTFVPFGGTSAAAPHVAAGLILLTELRGSDEPLALKAVLLNTADAWTDNRTLTNRGDDGPVTGSEWNPTYGWGYMDLFEAWLNGNDTLSSTINSTTSRFRLFRGQLSAGEKATLVWNRHIGFNGSNAPSAVEALTDLDLYVYRESTGTELDSSTSAIDNVEQVAVTSSGNVMLKVKVSGSIDPDVGTESFVVATEAGFTEVATPSFNKTVTPFLYLPNIPETLRITVTNRGGINAVNTRVDITGKPSGFTITSGSDPQRLGTVGPRVSATATWGVRWNCSRLGQSGTIRYKVTATSFNENLSETGTKTIRCENIRL